jgi:putative methyltransferase (TIGR04325 family)
MKKTFLIAQPKWQFGELKAVIRNIALTIPLVSDTFRYFWSFSHYITACRGIYSTYDEAKRAGANITRLGYNQNIINEPEIMGEPAHMRRRDYPVLFWLAPELTEGTTLLNLGGNAGTEYFTYRQFLRFQPNMRWLVWELPYAVKFGEGVVDVLDAPELAFTTRVEEGDGADIVLASGALQYFEQDLATYVKSLRKRPTRIFVNRVPLYEGKTYFTLQNVIGSVVPYRIQCRQELVDSLSEIGYRLIDCWYEDHEIPIPFHPECRVKGFYGFYFLSNEVDQPDWRANAVATAMQMRELAKGTC